jgi:peptidyl-prolyl cis-trans isomerase-like 2
LGDSLSVPVLTPTSRAIVDFITDYGVHPVSGEPLTNKDLKRLHFHKNANGKFFCPIMDKEFTESSHIVAVGPSGNVYSWEAIEELNIKRRHWKDLLTDEPFRRKDLITIQDPQNPPVLHWSDYHHIKQAKVEEAERTQAPKKPKLPVAPSLKYDGGFTCAGFSGAPETQLSEAEKPGLVVKEKALLQILTNLGPLNIELRSDLTPKTCENFLGLCNKGYYNGTVFHRNIPGFMVRHFDPCFILAHPF